MLRGPQTPGELKQRAERMHPFADLADVHDALGRLIARDLVAELPRRPGQKEERYTQLMGEDADDESSAFSEAPQPYPESAGEPVGHEATPGPPPPANGALQALTTRVEQLEREVAELRAALGD
jgi:uncharacterized protein YceH (UPF0502 family)